MSLADLQLTNISAECAGRERSHCYLHQPCQVHANLWGLLRHEIRELGLAERNNCGSEAERETHF